MERRVILFILGILLLAAPLVFSWRLYDTFESPKEFLFKASTILIATTWILAVIKGKGPIPRGTPLDLPIWLLLAWGFLSLVNSLNLRISIRAYGLLLSQVIFFYATVCYTRGGSMQRRLLGLLILSATLSGLVGILQYFGLRYGPQGITFSWPEQPVFKDDIFSTHGHPNFLGSFLAAVFPLALLLSWAVPGRLQRLSCLLGSAIIVFGLYLTRSKGAWLASFTAASFMAITLLYLYRNYLISYKKAFISGILLILLVIPSGIYFLGYLFPGKVSPLKEVSETLSPVYPRNRVRLLIWHVSLEMIRDHPWLGVGLGSYALNYQPYQGEIFSRLKDPEFFYPVYGETRRAHNEYLELAASGGLPILGLFLWLLYRYFKQGLRLLSSLVERGDKLLILGSMAGIVALLTDSLVSFPLQLIPTAMVFWFYLGFPLSLIERSSALPEIHPRLPKGRLLPGVSSALVGIIGLGLLILTFRPIVGEAIKRDVYRLMAQGRWREVILLAKKGLRWDPLDSGLHLYLGAAYQQLGLYQKALEAYQHSYRRYPNFEIAYNIGLIYQALGHYSLAEEYLLRAVRYKPTLWEGYQRLAELYQAQGKQAEYLRYSELARRFRQ